MTQNNALIKQLNKEIDHCLKNGEYDKTDDLCKRLCLARGLVPADHMPENFPEQLKRKEHETMHIRKTPRRISGIVAAAAAAVLLIGGTVSAAAIYNGNIQFTVRGLTAADPGEDYTASFVPEGSDLPVDLHAPELSGEDVITPISEETGTSSTPWLEKKVWDDTYEVASSDDAVNWEKGYQTTRTTQYRYADYFTAADDAGFQRVFRENYSGDVFYQENEHLPDESDQANGIGSTTDYNITGEFICGKGHFTLEQFQDGTGAGDTGEAAAEKSAFVAITTTGETENEREYLSASGITFKLTDDNATETGETKTTTMLTGNGCHSVFTFMGMTEAEIHKVLDNVKAY